MRNDEAYQCLFVHNDQEIAKPDQLTSRHSCPCIGLHKPEYHKVLTGTNDTDITVNCHQDMHHLHSRMGPDLCSALSALYTLTGCDSTKGTKMETLEDNAEALLSEFSKSPILPPSALENAEKFPKKKRLSANFWEEMHHSQLTSHLNHIPTNQGLQPHIEREHYNTYR